MTGWVERGWTDDDGNRWVTTADGARNLGPNPYLSANHGGTMTRDAKRDAMTRAAQHVTDATSQMRQAWQAAAPHIGAAARTIGGLGDQLAAAYTRDVTEWGRSGRRTWKRIH